MKKLVLAAALLSVFSLSSFADDKAATERAEAGYKAALAECKKLQGDAQQACMKDAQAARDKAIAESKK
jgi:hypothetical protein